MIYFLISVEPEGKIHAWCLMNDQSAVAGVGADAAERFPHMIHMLAEVDPTQLEVFG